MLSGKWPKQSEARHGELKPLPELEDWKLSGSVTKYLSLNTLKKRFTDSTALGKHVPTS